MSAFTFIDLFAGIGGMRRPFEQLGGRCVFTSEKDKFARKTYRANFRDDHEINCDIKEVEAEEIPPHDLLLAGFPCQPFSLAGVSKKNSLNRPHGFRDDAQGTLFFDIARILEHHRPAAFLLENVKNLAGHDRGKTFGVIGRTLKEELGYHASWSIIDARHWVPQHRERLFIVGFREPPNPFAFSDVVVPRQAPRLGEILESSVDDRYTLTDGLWTYLQRYRAKHRAKGNGFGFTLSGPGDVARTLSARYFKDGSEILIPQPGNPRRLTPRECARLMGFPADFRIPVSDTQAYRQFGNSVAMPVVRAIAESLAPNVAARAA